MADTIHTNSLSIQDEYSLTPLQQGMLFNNLRGEEMGVDVEQIVCSLEERLDIETFKASWKRCVDCHPILRTSLQWERHAEPVQRVHPSVDLPYEINTDLRKLSEAEAQRRLEAFLENDRRRGFDLKEAPLMRVTIFPLEEADYRIVWTFSHILLDGRSFTTILQEVFEQYEALQSGGDPVMDPPRSFKDHVSWVQNQDWTAAEAFWRDELEGITSPTPLPHDYAPETGEGGDTSVRDRVRRQVSTSLTDRLHERTETDDSLTVNTFVQAAWGLLLSRYSGEKDVVFGATRAGRKSSVDGAESMIGMLINTLPVRVSIDENQRVSKWLRQVRQTWVDMRPYEHTPLVNIQEWSDVPGEKPLFNSLVVFERYDLNAYLQSLGEHWENRSFRLLQHTGYPLTMYGYDGDRLTLELAHEPELFEASTIERLLDHLENLLDQLTRDFDQKLGAVDLLTDQEKSRRRQWNDTARPFLAEPGIQVQIAEQAAATPDAPALAFEDETYTYKALDRRSNQMARYFQAQGVAPGDRVGVCVERSPEMVAALLGIWKAGAAYVPLDPTYPAQRIRLVINDAELDALVTQSDLTDRVDAYEGPTVRLDRDWSAIRDQSAGPLKEGATGDDPAYVMYTSGSTGRPKGVVVTHRNLANFFAGMDERVVRHEDRPNVWLAVTSISFDISVLELFWTLARGFKVVLQGDEHRLATASGHRTTSPTLDRPVDFSLFYFTSDEKLDAPSAHQASEKYQLLIEGAQFADEHGFEAVWTPERHFHDFGGLYPNPSVISAAIAQATERVGIRAGSCVAPLHHSVRIAEEWAVVDNLSDGRVGVSFASGWQPDDFVIQPEAYADRKERMFEQIEEVQALWQGEALDFPDHEGEETTVRTLPRPVQDELPTWITAAGNPETFRAAGAGNHHLLTHLLGQSVDELAEKIDIYREARAEAGHDPEAGRVTLMLHTFVGDDTDTVREIVRKPMKSYLDSAMGLVKKAAWSFPAYKKRTTDEEGNFSLDHLSEEDVDEMLDFAFERYFEASGLFGTPERCMDLVHDLAAVGVDEVACLLDFGVDAETVLDHLPALNAVRERAAKASSTHTDDAHYSIPANIERHGVTHLQCTPAQARLLLDDEDARTALEELDHLMVGGETFPVEVARELRELVAGRLTNMYGPTETTIWSTTHEVEEVNGPIPIGRPIANTDVYILDDQMRPVPIGVPGELYIGGEGVAAGYHNRPEKTAEQFVDHPFSEDDDARLYRTGDLARYRSDGVIEFLGREDHQVKIRGHRVELGAVEAALDQLDPIEKSVVTTHSAQGGADELVAYVVPGDHEASVAPQDTRRALRDVLPPFMIPAHIVMVEKFPLTPNGKVDRAALSDQKPSAAEPSPSYVAPQDDLEEAIAKIWEDLLQVDTVGRTDNFFDLGGHSLLALRVRHRLAEQLEREVAVVDLFEYPTVRALAQYLTGGEGPSGVVQGVDRGRRRQRALRQLREP